MECSARALPLWIPAFAGMTEEMAGRTEGCAGMAGCEYRNEGQDSIGSYVVEEGGGGG